MLMDNIINYRHEYPRFDLPPLQPPPPPLSSGAVTTHHSQLQNKLHQKFAYPISPPYTNLHEDGNFLFKFGQKYESDLKSYQERQEYKFKYFSTPSATASSPTYYPNLYPTPPLSVTPPRSPSSITNNNQRHLNDAIPPTPTICSRSADYYPLDNKKVINNLNNNCNFEKDNPNYRHSVIMKVEDQKISYRSEHGGKRLENILSDDEHMCKWKSCYRIFNTLESLANHVTKTHAIASAGGLYYCQWHACPRSDRGFNARYKMLVHVRTHTKEKPHQCSQCEKCFSRAENLKIHIRSHSGEKPYACPVEGCTKAYSNSSDRFKHTRTHSTEKPYFCKIPGCNKRYTDPSSLRKHVKTFKHINLSEMVTPSIYGNNAQHIDTPSITRRDDFHHYQRDERIYQSFQHHLSAISPASSSHPLTSNIDNNCFCPDDCFDQYKSTADMTKLSKLGHIFDSFQINDHHPIKFQARTIISNVPSLIVDQENHNYWIDKKMSLVNLLNKHNSNDDSNNRSNLFIDPDVPLDLSIQKYV